MHFLEKEGKHEGNYFCCCIAVVIKTPNLNKDGVNSPKTENILKLGGGNLITFPKIKNVSN